jgi:Pycsar effector protein
VALPPTASPPQFGTIGPAWKPRWTSHAPRVFHTPVNRSEFAADTRSYITDYIKFGDTKAGAVLTLALAVAGAVSTVFEKIIISVHGVSSCVVVLAVLSGGAVAVGTLVVVWFCVTALSPRVTPAGESLASFPDIAANPDAFLEQSKGLTDDEIPRHLEVHVAALAGVANAKFAAIRTAVAWLRVQIIGACLLFVLYVLIRIAYSPT